MCPETLCAQTPKVIPDSVKAAITPDTLAQSTDTLKVAARKGGVETTINYHARDSIRFDVVSKTMYLFGEAHIDYGATSLDADQIQINWENSTLTANGTPDSTGKLIGVPLFKDGEEQYQAEKITYNYKTKRGKISNAVTKQGEGYIHAETVKKNADNTLFGRNAQYTTCDLAHPHFFINSSKMKVEPGKKVITGPFNLWIGDVPTPVGFLFGLFPQPKKRASGILIPTFGQTRNRGFYLRNGGYYWAFNDYIGLKFIGDVYSFGGGAGSFQGDYYKRYSYRGNFNLTYTYVPRVNNGADASVSSPFALPPGDYYSVLWQHAPIPKPGAGQFRADVNATTPGGNKYATNPGQVIATTFTSSISYSKTVPNTPFSYDVRLSQSQTGNRMDFILPDFTFAMSRVTPFGNAIKAPQGRWYESFLNQFAVDYRFVLRNTVSNFIQADADNAVQRGEQYVPLSINSDNLSRIFENANNGAEHNVGLTLGSYKVLKYLTLAPTVMYREAWFLKQLEYQYRDSLRRAAVSDTLSGFNRVYEYGAGASLSTVFYGMYNFKGKVKAIRHTVNPSVTYGYKPNFTSPNYGYFQYVQNNPDGRFDLLSRYNGFVFSAPSNHRQNQVDFMLRNSVEMKIKSKKDTLNEFQKISLIDNLTFNTRYNFAADSFQMGTINVNLSTNLMNRVNTNFNVIFDPYQFKDGRVINEYQYKQGGLARLINASMNISTDLNPDNWKRPQRVATNNYPITPYPTTTSYPETALMPEYVEFDIKWAVQLGFNASYTNPKYVKGPVNQTKNLDIRGTVNPTEKWKVQFQTGYDLENKQPTITRFDIYRDLHCWEMSIGWTPFGAYQGYFVNINVKSSILRDLKISRNQTFTNF